MSIPGSAHRIESHFPPRHAINAPAVELQASLAREEALRERNGDLLRRQSVQSMEFEHRLFNGLQLISSLLLSQSRAASPDAATQLTIAASRISTLGCVHRRLHLLDHQERVEFKPYLQDLCQDLVGVLFHGGLLNAIDVQGENFDIPTAIGIPLAFIVTELITNSAKYAKGNISVRLEGMTSANRSLSVLDDGPGLPAGFKPANSKGLGMKLVLSFVKQIGGELHTSSGEIGRGARFTVKFCAARLWHP